ncbi:hypothetical protein BGZ63DRAFT_367221 [Mariannaea sp. PMI_226]|nr:hypothetical protein BGZ63DRAFT_367221 [Mariannaea sp. PMI_226]
MLFCRSRRLANRRLSYLVLGLLLFAFAVFLLSPHEPTAAPIDPTKNEKGKPKEDAKKGSKDGPENGSGNGITKSILNPFRQPSHPPLRQKDDEYKGTSWWADWKWLAVPFSSSITLDEDRALLPPLPDRPLIFCYYDSSVKKARSEKDAESDLLLTWRRAWWAHGFRPILISPSEAMSNGKYHELQALKVDPNLKIDLLRWLAWESMGAGILTNYTVLPMADTSDPMISFLRKGEFPKLTMYKDIGNGLLVGQSTDVDKLLKALLASSSLEAQKNVIDIVGKDAFTVDNTPTGLAYYDSDVISKNYGKVWSSFGETRAKGLNSLNNLITAHLHMTWQNQFSEGIEVLQPFPDHTTLLIEPALKLASFLGACPKNPVPSSCPPNIPKCTYCKEGDTSALKITRPTQYRNTSRVFSVGTVPHPWTLASLNYLKEDLDVAWIRNESPRDPWLQAITEELLGTDVSGYLRVLRFKQAVADEGAATRAIWLTPEAEIPSDIDWQFGFSMNEEKSKTDKSKDESKDKSKEGKSKRGDKTLDTKGKSEEENKKGGDKKDEKKKDEKKKEEEEKEKALSPEELKAKEKDLFEKAKRVINLTKKTDQSRTRASLEAWNLADTEAWKFARAYLARRRKIRSEWEKQEAKYVGGAGSEGGRSSWSRWRDED